MTRLMIGFTSIIMLYFCYGIYVAQSDFDLFPPELKPANPPGFHDYRGVANVQTNLSRGSANPAQVIDEAKKAGLDFLILTDANQFEPTESVNGYYDNILVMSEAEYSFLDSRILIFNETPERQINNLNEANLFLTDLLSQEKSQSRMGLAILAHPYANGQPTWSGAYPSGLHGLEILNPKSMSAQAWQSSKFNVFWSFVVYPFNTKYAFLRLFREPRDEASLWDKISSERTFYGFAGADASARAVPLSNYFIRFPSYQKSMEIVSNHLILNSELTGNFHKDRQKIFSAFRNGHFYMSVDLLGDPKGFNVTVNGSDQEYLMGSRIAFRPGLHIVARLGHAPTSFYEIVLLKNGQREETRNSPELDYEIKSPGVYRIQVRVSPSLPLPDAKKWITWIYSNPFFIDPK